MKNRVRIVLAAGIAGLLVYAAIPGAERPAWAQTERTRRITEFEVPDFDGEMRLRSKLFGEYARIMPDGEVEITNMRIEFYTEDEDVEMQVFSPECTYDRTTRKARSDSEIHIARDNMIVTGRGFVWNPEVGRFQIFNDARVLLKGLGRDLQLGGLE